MKKIIFLIIMLLLVTQTTLALIELNKEKINFENVLPGNQYEQIVKLTTQSEKDIIVKAEVTGGLADQIKIYPKRRILNNKYPVQTKIIIDPTKDQIGYVNYCFSTEASLISTEGTRCIQLEINIKLGTEEIKQVEIIKVILHDTEPESPLDLEIITDNKGNQYGNLQITIGEQEYELITKAQQKETNHIAINNIYTPGTYHLPIIIKYEEKEIYNQEHKTNIETGKIKKIVTELITTEYNLANQESKIEIMMQNKGEIGLETKTKIWIYQNEILKEELKEEDFLGKNEQKNKEFITKLPPGDYLIRTQTYYDNTYTDMKEKKLTVIDSENPVGLATGYAGVLILIFALFIYTQRGKKKK